jgi:hypothetical protein
MTSLNIAVFPSAALIPANVLRFHFRFDEVQTVDVENDLVRLVDDHGIPVRHALLDVPGGIWSPSGNFLTQLVHPGRIKTGLASHDAYGMALQPGREYSIEIDQSALRADGTRSSPEWCGVHRFQATLPLKQSIAIGDWHVRAPRAGTLEPLLVTLDRALDRLSLESSFAIQDDAGVTRSLALEIAPGETAVRLSPGVPWRHDHYRLLISPQLEDVCGNRMDGAFEAGLDARQQTGPVPCAITFEASK